MRRRPFPKLSGPAILAPMAGVTDVAFRAQCKRYGAALTYTEFVSSAALVRDNTKTEELLVTSESERPVGVQLFGANEEEVVGAAKKVAARFDVVDMNCGCPAHKVVKTGAGSALLSSPAKIGRLVAKVVAAVDKPVTIKIRAGLDEKSVNAVEVAKAAVAAGAAAITVHGRTQQQGYGGKADWKVVKEVVEAVDVPVIGNGDVTTAEEFLTRWRESGCAYVMVGRGAIGNPFFFAEINAAVKGEAVPEAPDKISLFKEYLALAREHDLPFPQVKGQALHYTKGLRGGAKLRDSLSHCQSEGELLKMLAEYEALVR